MGWYGFKLWLEASTGLAMDALHVHAGIVCQLLAVLLLRRPLSSLLPWLAVLALALLNETYDLRIETWPDRDTQWFESVKDVVNTMLLPTLLLVLARWAPRIFVRPSAPAVMETEDETQA